MECISVISDIDFEIHYAYGVSNYYYDSMGSAMPGITALGSFLPQPSFEPWDEPAIRKDFIDSWIFNDIDK